MQQQSSAVNMKTIREQIDRSTDLVKRTGIKLAEKEQEILTLKGEILAKEERIAELERQAKNLEAQAQTTGQQHERDAGTVAESVNALEQASKDLEAKIGS